MNTPFLVHSLFRAPNPQLISSQISHMPQNRFRFRRNCARLNYAADIDNCQSNLANRNMALLAERKVSDRRLKRDGNIAARNISSFFSSSSFRENTRHSLFSRQTCRYNVTTFTKTAGSREKSHLFRDDNKFSLSAYLIMSITSGDKYIYNFTFI